MQFHTITLVVIHAIILALPFVSNASASKTKDQYERCVSIVKSLVDSEDVPAAVDGCSYEAKAIIDCKGDKACVINAAIGDWDESDR